MVPHDVHLNDILHPLVPRLPNTPLILNGTSVSSQACPRVLQRMNSSLRLILAMGESVAHLSP
jgi:hypothetical protein